MPCGNTACFLVCSVYRFLSCRKSISKLKDKVLNPKDVVITNLHKENYLQEKVVSLGTKETKRNHLDQFGRRNNLVLSVIPDTVEDKD